MLAGRSQRTKRDRKEREKNDSKDGRENRVDGPGGGKAQGPRRIKNKRRHAKQAYYRTDSRQTMEGRTQKQMSVFVNGRRSEHEQSVPDFTSKKEKYN